MHEKAIFLLSSILLLSCSSEPVTDSRESVIIVELSDDEVRQAIIDDSIQSYSANWPCPYNLASNGSRCGGRSAYSRPGGASPICYATDISDEAVEEYRRTHKK